MKETKNNLFRLLTMTLAMVMLLSSVCLFTACDEVAKDANGEKVILDETDSSFKTAEGKTNFVRLTVTYTDSKEKKHQKLNEGLREEKSETRDNNKRKPLKREEED